MDLCTGNKDSNAKIVDVASLKDTEEENQRVFVNLPSPFTLKEWGSEELKEPFIVWERP